MVSKKIVMFYNKRLNSFVPLALTGIAYFAASQQNSDPLSEP